MWASSKVACSFFVLAGERLSLSRARACVDFPFESVESLAVNMKI